MPRIPGFDAALAEGEMKAAFAAQLGPYNPVLYRVFFYRQGGYVELNQLPDDGCDLAGEAFWVLTRSGATLTLTEPDVRQNNGGTDRVIPISPGFNLVSLPTLNGYSAWAPAGWSIRPGNGCGSGASPKPRSRTWRSRRRPRR